MEKLLLRLVVLTIYFTAVCCEGCVIHVSEDQEGRDDEEHGLQTDGLDELVDDAGECVGGDLGAADLCGIGLHADFPLATGCCDGGDAEVGGAVVGGPVGGADGDIMVRFIYSACFLLGDVGLDSADGGVDEVHRHCNEEGVQDELRVVRQ